MARPAAAKWEGVRSLNPWEDNPRVNDAAVPAIAESIRRFGYGRPIVAWDRKGARRIVVGHTVCKVVLYNLRHHPGEVFPEVVEEGEDYLRGLSEAFRGHLDRIARYASKREVWAARLADFDSVFQAIVDTKGVLGVKNPATAVLAMSELAIERLEQLDREEPS